MVRSVTPCYGVSIRLKIPRRESAVPVRVRPPAPRVKNGAVIENARKISKMDTLTAAERSERMALIRSKDTKPEWAVRQLVHRLGYRYRLHRKDLPGSPDLTFPSRKKVIFVHGCFWHAHKGCKVANRPKTHRPFWDKKFRLNVERDRANEVSLRNRGWKVLTIWECETKDHKPLAKRIRSFLDSRIANRPGRGARNGRK